MQGSYVALVTPLNGNRIATDQLQSLIEWQIQEGTEGIVLLGTTGESATLTQSEYRTVLTAGVEAAQSRVPIIAGATSNNPVEAASLAGIAQSCHVDGLLCAAGHYLKPSQEGLFQHFQYVHDHTELPIVIYNVPTRTIVNVEPETMARLAQLPRIVGVKDATHNLDTISLERALIKSPFYYFSGDDMTAPAYNALGGNGCISVTANVAPKLCADLQSACERGDFFTALTIHSQLVPLHQALFLEPSPAGVKYALARLGQCSAQTRIPITAVSHNTQQKIDSALALLTHESASMAAETSALS